MKRSTVATALLIAVGIPVTLYLGTRLPGRWYYFTSTLMLLEIMVPFFLAFETRRPQARELVTLAVMCALSVAARVVVLIPGFKPMVGIIMITGIALSPEAGFVTGAMAALASNFFFSQGPWTPWQMMGYGMAGYLAGALFYRRFPERRPWVLALFGFVTMVTLVGPLLDCCTLFTVSSHLSKRYALAVFAAGLPYNIQHGLAVGLTLLVLSKPMLEKLERLKRKYGILDIREA